MTYEVEIIKFEHTGMLLRDAAGSCREFESQIRSTERTCKERRRTGAITYGHESFYDKDNLQEAQEENYDNINYLYFEMMKNLRDVPDSEDLVREVYEIINSVHSIIYKVEKIKEKAKKLNLLNIQ